MPGTGVEPANLTALAKNFVGRRGLEPPRVAPYAPKAYAYTNFATDPKLDGRVCHFLRGQERDFPPPWRKENFTKFWT